MILLKLRQYTKYNIYNSYYIYRYCTIQNNQINNKNSNHIKIKNEFTSKKDYINYLINEHATLPKGFEIGTTKIEFYPEEVSHIHSKMDLTIIKPKKPTKSFSGVFTQNAFPGSPIIVGRKKIIYSELGGVIINNKISNVCAKGDGVKDSERLAMEVHKYLYPNEKDNNKYAIIPSSTGVIGWRLPLKLMIHNIKNIKLQDKTILPAAESIMTTDLYPKIYSLNIPIENDNKIVHGRITGIAKGAGMIEPNCATMLVYILTDIAIPRDILRELLNTIIKKTFNCITCDSDESTSDTILMISSEKIPYNHIKHYNIIYNALYKICDHLAEDIIRNGEGANHLIKCYVKNIPETIKTIDKIYTPNELAIGIGKSIVNSPLVKCAVNGNDPNIGRIIMAIGKYIGKIKFEKNNSINLNKMKVKMGNILIFENGTFLIDEKKEKILIQHMKNAELQGIKDGKIYKRDYPPHNNAVEIEVDFCDDKAKNQMKVLGMDLTNEYVNINADYRS